MISIQLRKLMKQTAIKNEMSFKRPSMEKIKPVYEHFTGWADEFAGATTERKKMIISRKLSEV